MIEPELEDFTEGQLALIGSGAGDGQGFLAFPKLYGLHGTAHNGRVQTDTAHAVDIDADFKLGMIAKETKRGHAFQCPRLLSWAPRRARVESRPVTPAEAA